MTGKRMIVAAIALLASGAARADSVDWSRAARIEFGLESFKFVPDTITLTHGSAYVLHLVNHANAGHDFVAKAFFAHATLAAQDKGLVRNGAVELHGGQSVDVHLVAPGSGTYDLHCSHFMHSAMGMIGQIVVR